MKLFSPIDHDRCSTTAQVFTLDEDDGIAEKEAGWDPTSRSWESLPHGIAYSGASTPMCSSTDMQPSTFSSRTEISRYRPQNLRLSLAELVRSTDLEPIMVVPCLIDYETVKGMALEACPWQRIVCFNEMLSVEGSVAPSLAEEMLESISGPL